MSALTCGSAINGNGNGNGHVHHEPDHLPLAAGRQVIVVRSSHGEEVQFHSPEGEIELRVSMTETGPVVRMSAARLELDDVDDVDFRCKRIKMHATETATLSSDGQIWIQALSQILMRAHEEMDLKGRPIRRNVRDGLFYSDYVVPVNGPDWGTAFEGIRVPDLVQLPVWDPEKFEKEHAHNMAEIERYQEEARQIREMYHEFKELEKAWDLAPPQVDFASHPGTFTSRE